MTIYVLSSSGLRLPRNGIRADQTDLKIATNDVLGPVQPSAITRVSPVGVLFNTGLEITSSDHYACGIAGVDNGAVYAGRPARLVVWFSSITAFGAGDSVVLHLPGFFGVSTDVTDPSSSAYVSSIRWVMEQNKQCPKGSCLILRLGAVVDAGKSVCITAGSANGISVPVAGVRADDQTLTIETNATLGPVSPTPFEWLRAVGALAETSLSYSSRRPGRQAAVTIQFVPYMNLTVNDVVSVKLLGFNCTYPSNADLPVSSTSFGARYRFDGAALVVALRVLKGQAPNTLATVTILISAGIVLPQTDMMANNQSLTIQVVAVEGNVSETAISTSPSTASTGTLENFEVLFPHADSPPRAGQPADMLLRFKPSFELGPGDKIVVFLSGFSGPDLTNWTLLNSDPAGAVLSISWFSVKSSIEFSIVGSISQANYMSLDIHWSGISGISLPSDGIVRDSGKYFAILKPSPVLGIQARSEERRVGKECRL